MTVLVLDDFSRLADSESLASDPVPAPTNTPGNSWTGVINAVGATGGGALTLTATSARCFLNVGTASGKVSAVRDSASFDGILEMRQSGATTEQRDCYGLLIRPGAGQGRIVRFDGTTRTDLLSDTMSVPTGNHKYSLSCTGTGPVNLEWFRDDVSQGTYADSSASLKATGNVIGVKTIFGPITWDDIEFDDLVSGGASTGSLNVTLDGATVAGAGALAIEGQAAPTLDGATVAGTGAVAIEGQLGATLGGATLSAQGGNPDAVPAAIAARGGMIVNMGGMMAR